jgi:transposase
MPDKHSELRVVRRSRDGRRRYDEKAKRALVEVALRPGPGVSVARLAQEHGINANLLRKWIAKYLIEREKGISSVSQDDDAAERDLPSALEVIDGVPIDIYGPRKRNPPADMPSAFVPVVSTAPALPPVPVSPSMTLAIHVRLSNGVELDLGEASVDELSTVIQMLGRLPCSGATKT